MKKQMEMANTTVDSYDCLVLHQANLFILKQIAKRTGFPMDKTLVSIDEFGNTSSASIPISLVKEYGDIMPMIFCLWYILMKALMTAMILSEQDF